MTKKVEVAIGIDLGTTYSCVGVWEHNRVEIITNDQGNRTTPSYIAFTDSGRFIGDAAKNQAALNPANTIFGCFSHQLIYKHRTSSRCIIVLVGGSTRIPKVQQLLQEFFNGKELCNSINPGEVVAYGAAMHAPILNGMEDQDIRNILLLDVTSLSLGIGDEGDIMNVIIPRNTKFPTRKASECYTVFDGQTSMSLTVRAGERPRATNNNLMGEFTLYGIPPAPRGTIKVLVTFSIDADGVLNVIAECKIAGRKISITFSNYWGRLTKNEIDSLVREAEKYRAEDEEFKRKIKAMNAFEDYAYNMRRAIRANCNLKKVEMGKLEKAIKEAVQWLNANRIAEVDEYEYKKMELEAICTFIISRSKGISIMVEELSNFHD